MNHLRFHPKPCFSCRVHWSMSHRPRPLIGEGWENSPHRHQFLGCWSIPIYESQSLLKICFSTLGRGCYGVEESLCATMRVHNYELMRLTSVSNQNQGWLLYKVPQQSCPQWFPMVWPRVSNSFGRYPPTHKSINGWLSPRASKGLKRTIRKREILLFTTHLIPNKVVKGSCLSPFLLIRWISSTKRSL